LYVFSPGYAQLIPLKAGNFAGGSYLKRIKHLVWHHLSGLMPDELTLSEHIWILSPHAHPTLLSRQRAVLIVNRVRLMAFLFAVLTPWWSVIDYIVFPLPLWFALASMRLLASGGFVAVVVLCKPDGSLRNAYRAIAFLFVIPVLFYIGSHTLLANYELHGLSAAIGAGYAFLPFVLVAGFSIFPLTLDWPTFAGAFWLLILITGVSALAGMSQLAFLIALVRRAIRDSLTGTFSRRSGEELLELHFAASIRTGAPLSIAFIDLDGFKSINDGHGHDAGDAVLVNVVRNITPQLRTGDILTRWGGEEFVIVMPNTDAEQALIGLERVRAAGLGMRPERAPMTASIGVAERIADRATDWHALVELADARMYQAKQTGRDRIVSCSLPMADGSFHS